MERYGRNMAMRLIRKISLRNMLKGGWIVRRSNECGQSHWFNLVAGLLAERGIHQYSQEQFEAEKQYLASL